MTQFTHQCGTKIVFGQGVKGLGREAAAFGRRALVCYGGGSAKRNGILGAVCSELAEAGVAALLFEGVEPNPRVTTVERGAALCKKEGVEVVIAIGGGSVMDCAKMIAAATMSEGSVWELVTRRAPIRAALPVLTVVTIAATGSEMDAGAVITNWETHEKYGIFDDRLLPRVSFLEPRFTYTVPPFQTACGAADILSHVFDKYYFTLNEKLAFTDGVMEALMRAVVRFAPVAMREPENYEARANLMWAASWALNGYLSPRGGATSCHAMEHELSAYYDITHGLGLAILMPKWLRYCCDGLRAPQIKQFGVNVFGLEASVSDMDGAFAAIEALERFLYDALGLARTLTEAGTSKRSTACVFEKEEELCNTANWEKQGCSSPRSGWAARGFLRKTEGAPQTW